MLKKSPWKKVILFLSILILCGGKEVYAECDYDTQNELNVAASNVQAKYEIKEVILDEAGVEHTDIPEEELNDFESEYYETEKLSLNVLNIPDTIYFTIENLTDGGKNTYTSADLKDGIFTLPIDDFDTIREFEIKILSNNSSCKGNELRTINIITPMYNPIADTNYCEDEKAASTMYCQRFVTTKVELSDEARGTEKTEEEQKIEEEQKKNNILIIIGSVVALGVVIAIATIIVMKNKRKRII